MRFGLLGWMCRSLGSNGVSPDTCSKRLSARKIFNRKLAIGSRIAFSPHPGGRRQWMRQYCQQDSVAANDSGVRPLTIVGMLIRKINLAGLPYYRPINRGFFDSRTLLDPFCPSETSTGCVQSLPPSLLWFNSADTT